VDATFLAVRRDGPKEGVLVAWGFTEDGERVLLAVMLGMRESHEDWLALGRDLIARGLGAPMLIVADGAPGLIKAIEQCWPASDRQHCAVHSGLAHPRAALAVQRSASPWRPPAASAARVVALACDETKERYKARVVHALHRCDLRGATEPRAKPSTCAIA
jgi:hypothetical protein